jgi:chaperonin GroEL
MRAINAPLTEIANNAGLDGPVVVDKVRNGRGDFGFDAAKLTYTNLLEDGIIDPAKVARCAIQNAASVAGLLLTTEALIAEKSEKDEAMTDENKHPENNDYY